MARRALSEHERQFIVSGVQEDLRADGRSRRDCRHFEVTSDPVSNTSGSSKIRMEGTTIMVGVKAEIGTPDSQHPDWGRIEFYVDCSALASPDFQGREGENLGQHLAHRLAQVYQNRCIDFSKLSIVAGTHCWVLYVDALVIEWSGGVLDCLSIAIKHALSTTRIPKLNVSGEGEEVEIEVSDNPYDYIPLDATHLPIIVSLSMIGGHFVIDASQEEESCAECNLSVAIAECPSLSVYGTLLYGAGSLPYHHYQTALSLAGDVAGTIMKRLEYLTAPKKLTS